MTIPELFKYMIWGDQRMLRAAATCSNEGYHRELGISMGSVHKMLVHCLAVQEIWLSRWQRVPLTKFTDANDLPTLAALNARWPMLHTQLMAFAESQNEASLSEPITYTNTQGRTYTFPLREMMIHVTDHASYHRGQINSMIKLAGGTPVPIMYFTYQLELTGQS